MLKKIFADMHVHIGQGIDGKPIKITASPSLTLLEILKESSRRKGIQMIGVVDSQAPIVQKEIKQLIDQKQAYELKNGGIRFEKVTLILGVEIEVYDQFCQGPIHVLCYFPFLEQIAQFSSWLTDRMKNISLSSQRYYGVGKDLQHKVKQLGGLFIPAHVFTPFKSLYGKGVKKSLCEVFHPSQIDAIELGLSSDTKMADQIAELHAYTYLSNSDAHSLAKIAREYQEIEVKEASFLEFKKAIHSQKGRKVTRNFGLDPKLGKYYTTVCQKCLSKATPDQHTCTNCLSTKIVKGVYDRIQELATQQRTPKRPPYIHQVPLEYLPSLGPKTIEKLLQAFKTEMNIIHHVPYEDLKKVIPEKVAKLIIQMRQGQLSIQAGGGGKYGRVTDPS